MRTTCLAILLACFTSCLPKSSGSEVESSSVVGFIPAGWSIEFDTVSTSLLPGKSARLVVLQNSDSTSSLLGSRRLLLFREDNSTLIMIQRSDSLIQPRFEGMLSIEDVREYVNIEDRILSISTEWKTGGATYKFRYDPKFEAFNLIGFDLVDLSIHDSRNYLKGTRILKLSSGDSIITRSLKLRGKTTSLYSASRDMFEIDAAEIQDFQSDHVPESIREQLLK